MITDTSDKIEKQEKQEVLPILTETKKLEKQDEIKNLSTKSTTAKILNKVNAVLERKVFKTRLYKNGIQDMIINKELKDIKDNVKNKENKENKINKERDSKTNLQKVKKKLSYQSKGPNNQQSNMNIKDKINFKYFMEFFLVLNEREIQNNFDTNNNQINSTISKNFKQAIENINISSNSSNKNLNRKFSLDLSKINYCPCENDNLNKVNILSIINM